MTDEYKVFGNDDSIMGKAMLLLAKEVTDCNKQRDAGNQELVDILKELAQSYTIKKVDLYKLLGARDKINYYTLKADESHANMVKINIRDAERVFSVLQKLPEDIDFSGYDDFMKTVPLFSNENFIRILGGTDRLREVATYEYLKYLEKQLIS